MKQINEASRETTFFEAVENFGLAYNNILIFYKLILEIDTVLEQSEQSIKLLGNIMKC